MNIDVVFRKRNLIEQGKSSNGKFYLDPFLVDLKKRRGKYIVDRERKKKMIIEIGEIMEFSIFLMEKYIFNDQSCLGWEG